METEVQIEQEPQENTVEKEIADTWHRAVSTLRSIPEDDKSIKISDDAAEVAGAIIAVGVAICKRLEADK